MRMIFMYLALNYHNRVDFAYHVCGGQQSLSFCSFYYVILAFYITCGRINLACQCGLFFCLCYTFLYIRTHKQAEKETTYSASHILHSNIFVYWYQRFSQKCNYRAFL